jgi:hypothetical protein
MAKYICRRRLQHGGGWLEPGMEFPIVPSQNWRPLLSMGWIEKVEDSVPISVQPTRPRAPTIPADLSKFKKAELFDLIDELGIGEIDGTGSGGLVTKADLIRAIKSYGNS